MVRRSNLRCRFGCLPSRKLHNLHLFHHGTRQRRSPPTGGVTQAYDKGEYMDGRRHRRILRHCRLGVVGTSARSFAQYHRGSATPGKVVALYRCSPTGFFSVKCSLGGGTGKGFAPPSTHAGQLSAAVSIELRGARPRNSKSNP